MMEQVVTFYQRQDGQPVGWVRHVLTNVLFREAAGTALSEQGVRGGQLESLLLIPMAAGVSPKPGDGIVSGVGPESDFSGDIREHVPGCRIITAVTARNYGSHLDHWEVKAR